MTRLSEYCSFKRAVRFLPHHRKGIGEGLNARLPGMERENILGGNRWWLSLSSLKFFEPLPHQILNIRDLILSSHNTPKALSSLFPFQRWENSGWAAMMGWSNLEWGSNLPKSHRKIWVLKLTLVFLYPVTLAKLLWSPGQAAPCFKPERTMPRAS